MKAVIIRALIWGVLMFAGLCILDFARGNDINWFIAAAAAVVITVFKFMMGYAEEMSKKRQ